MTPHMTPHMTPLTYRLLVFTSPMRARFTRPAA